MSFVSVKILGCCCVVFFVVVATVLLLLFCCFCCCGNCIVVVVLASDNVYCYLSWLEIGLNWESNPGLFVSVHASLSSG